MSVFRVISLINLCLVIASFSLKIITAKAAGSGKIIGTKKTRNTVMSALLVVSSIILFLLWISQIINFSPLNRFFSPPLLSDCLALDIAALVFICAGTALEILSVLTINESFRIHSPGENEKTNLVTHGIYGVIRNPIVCGIFCYAFGVMFFNPGILTLAMFILVVISYNHKVDVEAADLEKRFGNEWDNYCGRTGKYFPRLAGKTTARTAKEDTDEKNQ